MTLQNPPYRCFTKYRSIVIVTQSGELLLWSFGHGLTKIDMTMPQGESDNRGTAEPEQTHRAPLSAFEIQNSRVMFHPRDEEVFFMATFDDRSLKPEESLLLWVYEVRNKQCCRAFTYSVPPEKRHYIIFDAQKIDAHGTYQLLTQDNPNDDGIHISCVTFNTMSKSFGISRFQAPRDTDRGISLVWNNQLILRHYDPLESRLRPSSLLAIGQLPEHRGSRLAPDVTDKGRALESAVESLVMSVLSPKVLDTNVISIQQLQMAIAASKRARPKDDVVRAPDISPFMPGLSAAVVGLRYVLSLFGDRCNWKGPHVRACPQCPDPTTSERPLFPINECFRSSLAERQGGRVVAILGDDEFLVVVTNQDYYTVFAVDEDGKIAEAMRDESTRSTEGAS